MKKQKKQIKQELNNLSLNHIKHCAPAKPTIGHRCPACGYDSMETERGENITIRYRKGSWFSPPRLQRECPRCDYMWDEMPMNWYGDMNKSMLAIKYGHGLG